MFRIDGLSPCDIMQLYSGTTTSCRDPCKDRASTHQCNGPLLPWQVQQTNCASSRRISPASVIDTRSPWDLRSIETWFGSEGGFGKGPATDRDRRGIKCWKSAASGKCMKTAVVDVLTFCCKFNNLKNIAPCLPVGSADRNGTNYNMSSLSISSTSLF